MYHVCTRLCSMTTMKVGYINRPSLICFFTQIPTDVKFASESLLLTCTLLRPWFCEAMFNMLSKSMILVGDVILLFEGSSSSAEMTV